MNSARISDGQATNMDSPASVLDTLVSHIISILVVAAAIGLAASATFEIAASADVASIPMHCFVNLGIAITLLGARTFVREFLRFISLLVN